MVDYVFIMTATVIYNLGHTLPILTLTAVEYSSVRD